MQGYMYILECSDGSYYTGSTIDLARRFLQHLNGEGANHTKKHLPVKLVYVEIYPRIDYAFYREKQVQGWSRKKKEALISGNTEKLPELAMAYRDIRKGGFGSLSHLDTGSLSHLDSEAFSRLEADDINYLENENFTHPECETPGHSENMGVKNNEDQNGNDVRNGSNDNPEI